MKREVTVYHKGEEGGGRGGKRERKDMDWLGLFSRERERER